MARSQFSETQFTFGYVKELFQRIRPRHDPFFMFPSTIYEARIPADFIIDYYTHSEFFQFKRSQHLTRLGRAERDSGIDSTFAPYYRFKIYNSRNTRQFEKLKELAARFQNDEVYYCAPLFHTELEYQHYFWTNQIQDMSVLIDCKQFNNREFNVPDFDINDGEQHFAIYKRGPSANPFSRKMATTGYLCSKPREIKVTSGYKLYERRDSGSNSFKDLVNSLFKDYTYHVERLKLNGDKQNQEYDIITKAQIVWQYLYTAYNIFWIPITR